MLLPMLAFLLALIALIIHEKTGQTPNPQTQPLLRFIRSFLGLLDRGFFTDTELAINLFYQTDCLNQ